MLQVKAPGISNYLLFYCLAVNRDGSVFVDKCLSHANTVESVMKILFSNGVQTAPICALKR